MDFLYYDSNNQIKKLDIKIGSKWSEVNIDNSYLNSIFKSVDDGDGVVQENEISIIKFLLKNTDSKIKKIAGGKIIHNSVLKQINRDLSSKYDIESLKCDFDITIDLDDYTLKNLKKRYPEDKYVIEVTDDCTSIYDKNTHEAALTITKNNNGITIEENQSAEGILSKSYNNNGKMTEYSFVANSSEIRYQSLLNDFHHLIQKSSRRNCDEEALIEQISASLERINSKNVIEIFNLYHQNYEVYLDAMVQSCQSPMRDIILDHLTKCLEDRYDYKHDFKNENSQIINQFHKGTSYTVDCQNEKIKITSNNIIGKERTLDLNEFVKRMPLEEQIRVKKLISELPGEVLMDLAIEAEFLVNFNKQENTTNADGIYHPKKDYISIKENSYNGTLVHELGHALDYNLHSYSSDACKRFNKAFTKGLDAYIAAGNTQCTGTPVPYQSPKGATTKGMDSNYATTNIHEMFAECYAYLMTGTCQSANVIDEFFPDCLKIAENMISEKRLYPDRFRHRKWGL